MLQFTSFENCMAINGIASKSRVIAATQKTGRDKLFCDFIATIFDLFKSTLKYKVK